MEKNSKLGVGKLLYKYIFAPTLGIRYQISHFGIAGSIRYAIGEKALKNAVTHLLPISTEAKVDQITFCFLTGKNYWHQTLLCVQSLHKQLSVKFNVAVYSDGSLSEAHVNVMRRAIPDASFILQTDVDERLTHTLPYEQYPTLNYLRNWHPFFKRMIDIHCAPGWKIHMDSDMIFFHNPVELRDAFENKKAIYMADLLTDSYFVDELQTLLYKYNIQCAPNVNGGIIAYNSDLVDYEDLEQKAKLLIDDYKNTGPARIEQTLMSYLLFKQEATALDPDRYKVLFDLKPHFQEYQVCRHYIFKAKLSYFTREWKKIIR
ncbi:hypothetical protein FPZ43_17115 [Mucilaginibacter pallidiroseus]|uniref:Nucleotide-diphospho-sugar transferase domain-containing protein n=1 Tax=Mucilaginibacter pallidiroseus TaxID=2599295 RepID=A0A563U1Z0_9SPHI|nr:hypothetical protein [Mucilaginibacter pallidiroseus]TWR25192.1 hypothetical protein FPZ43_17115 [Mucilaginibacter pallidiroseus]